MVKKCLYCDKEFEAKRESAMFCSGSHRTMYGRDPNNLKDITGLKLASGESVGKSVPVVFKSDVDVYCEGLGLTVWDLMEYHREHNKIKQKKEDNRPIERAYPLDGYPRGYVAPVPGTKAYFLKNGKFYP